MSEFRWRMMEYASQISISSPDPSTKVGAVITLGEDVISTGFNRIAKGIPHVSSQLEDRQWKYPRVIHAETAAILKMCASRVYQQRWEESFHIYCTHIPCEHCASLIIESGIKRVYTKPVSPEMSDRWPGMRISAEMFGEAGIPVTFIDN